MIVNNYTNWTLIKFSALLSFFITLNYMLWSINSLEIIKSINFIFLMLTFFYFFISYKFNDYWIVKIIIILLLIISLGSPTISWDARSIYIFSAKRLFYDSDLYIFLDNYFALGMNAFPKLPSTLSATFAQLLGLWNETFPKTTNIILCLPPILFLISFFKNRIFVLIFIFLILMLAGKLLVNGLMDGILSLYFVASIMTVYKISSTNKNSEKNIFYLILFLFFIILSLCKNEGTVMIFIILLSTLVVDLLYEKKINFKIFIITFLSLIPILFWKYLMVKNNITTEFIQYDPINRVLGRITNLEDIITILLFLIKNEKLIFSLFVFTFFSYKNSKEYKKLIFFVSLISVIYFSVLIGSFLLTPKDLFWQLTASSTRIFIPIAMLLTYFSIFFASKILLSNLK